MNAVIFDIDGTLANIEHRRHFVASKPKNWKAFSQGMKFDLPNDDIIWLMRLMYKDGVEILIASGRGEEDREATIEWLQKNGIFSTHDVAEDWDVVDKAKVVYHKLYMRPANDYRPDNIVKSEILDKMLEDGFEPMMAVDDRDQVVEMWRSRGIRCLQVANGAF
jgi:phosphoglycolate phosphatase-like HAD superfamily hydrolase